MNKTELKNTAVEAEVLPKAIEHVDFSTINGYQLIQCEKRTKEEDPMLIAPTSSMIFKAHLVAIATGRKVDDVYALPGPEFIRVINEAQRFLGGLDSKESN
ncbi:hypothetical protein [Megasphaera elsdenii]|uniref:hypothetical protein n=1 Tax=Megasphaera elsdenii TaxID=907 RepID=UPI002055ADBD|nr:hypothetical protein [Megasphaera elsdenii]DAY77695.1 MAG TPA: tail assembly chaperone protein [Caudoviricetes sp.]